MTVFQFRIDGGCWINIKADSREEARSCLDDKLDDLSNLEGLLDFEVKDGLDIPENELMGWDFDA